jgi:hypothetical protein
VWYFFSFNVLIPRKLRLYSWEDVFFPVAVEERDTVKGRNKVVE